MTIKSSRGFVAASIVAVVCLLTACDRATVYNHYEQTQSSGWERNDTLVFHLPKLKEGGTYKEEVGLRINSEFPFMAIALIVEQEIFPSGETLSDTLYATLTNKRGDVLGRGISLFQYMFDLTTLQLRENDSIQVNIRHNMKREILPGLSDVGIKLRRTK
jgi:gliding motility-associated lipoprotein GldH